MITTASTAECNKLLIINCLTCSSFQCICWKAWGPKWCQTIQEELFAVLVVKCGCGCSGMLQKLGNNIAFKVMGRPLKSQSFAGCIGHWIPVPKGYSCNGTTYNLKIYIACTMYLRHNEVGSKQTFIIMIGISITVIWSHSTKQWCWCWSKYQDTGGSYG